MENGASAAVVVIIVVVAADVVHVVAAIKDPSLARYNWNRLMAGLASV